MRTKLIASSATLDGISMLITEYFFGPKELRETAPNTWAVVNKDGNDSPYYRVVRKARRYRLEEIPEGDA